MNPLWKGTETMKMKKHPKGYQETGTKEENHPKTTKKNLNNMEEIMAVKTLLFYVGWTLCCVCLGIVISKAIDVYHHVEEISKEQKEMREMIEIWRQCI